jgi:hypothetical protein
VILVDGRRRSGVLLRKAVLRDYGAILQDLFMPFYGYNRDTSTVSKGVREAFWPASRHLQKRT